MSSTTDFENVKDDNSTFAFRIRQNFNNMTSNGLLSLYIYNGIKAKKNHKIITFNLHRMAMLQRSMTLLNTCLQNLQW